MATTIAEEITELEARLTSINNKISKYEMLRATEEGSTSSRFMTQFTNIDTIYQERDRIKTRLRTLEASPQ
jgi:uncharacterized protein with PhoU and TrkA domain